MAVVLVIHGSASVVVFSSRPASCPGAHFSSPYPESVCGTVRGCSKYSALARTQAHNNREKQQSLLTVLAYPRRGRHRPLPEGSPPLPEASPPRSRDRNMWPTLTACPPCWIESRGVPGCNLFRNDTTAGYFAAFISLFGHNNGWARTCVQRETSTCV